ncbi:BRI1 suppressor 1 3 [Perilla frutescens var. frutescens]|nr:BRI1 suppressor 1 3 [Perilla frutescens var. frutescens]
MVVRGGGRCGGAVVIAHLLKPCGWKSPVRRQFLLDCNEIADLFDSAEIIFSSEPSVLQLRGPIKIFGDLHGQFGDLMRLFDEYGSLFTAGDIAWKAYHAATRAIVTVNADF